MQRFKRVWVILSVLVMVACNDKPVNRALLEQDLRNRELLRLTDGQIADAGMEHGKQVLTEAQHLFQTSVQSNPMHSCTVFAKQYSDSLRKMYGYTFAMVTRADSIQARTLYNVLQAYAYNFTLNTSSEPNFQRMGTDSFMITTPFVYTKTACQKCHNTNKYASDTAFAGIWAIFEGKKNIVRSYKRTSKP